MAQEAWLSGPIEGVPALLMPVAHALLQAQRELHGAIDGLTVAQLWQRPGGAASAGFHLKHIAGITDRLLTYARAESLTAEQFATLEVEGVPGDPPADTGQLLQLVDRAIEHTLAHVRSVDPDTLLDAREVGRARLPSNVLGLLFHAAEHTQRHTGQVIVTCRVVRNA